MTMAITPSFLGLEGQSSSSLEADGIGHGQLHNSLLSKGDDNGHTPFLRRARRSDPLFSRRYGMATFTTLD